LKKASQYFFTGDAVEAANFHFLGRNEKGVPAWVLQQCAAGVCGQVQIEPGAFVFELLQLAVNFAPVEESQVLGGEAGLVARGKVGGGGEAGRDAALNFRIPVEGDAAAMQIGVRGAKRWLGTVALEVQVFGQA
jgi:hypothetical protein